MAMSAPPAIPAPAPGLPARSAPGWILALYLIGLVLVFIGERVLSGLERGGAEAVTLLGVVAAIAATVLRFSPRFRSGGERQSIETLLAILSVVGLVGLAVYFLSGDQAATRLGLDRLAAEKRERVEELLRVIWISLVLISVAPMAFAEAALRPMRHAERPESRRVRAAAATGVALALAAIYGSLFVYAASGVDLRVDYSYFKTSRASDSTKKLLASLSKPVEVVAFFPQVSEVRSEVAAYLSSVKSPKLKVRIEDRLLVPKLAKELNASQDGVLVLKQGEAKQTLSVGGDMDAARPKLKTLDRDFQEQLLKIAKSRKTVYLTAGHGEITDAGRGQPAQPGRSGKLVKALLQRQNLLVKDLGMAQGLAQQVPDDADLVLCLGPTEPFAREELATLSRYLDAGGKLFLALDADALSTRGTLTGSEASPPPDPDAETNLADAPDAGHEPPAGVTEPREKTPGDQGDGALAFYGDLAKVVGLTFSPVVLANERQHVRVRYNDSDRTRLVTNSFSSHASVSTLSRNAPRAAAVFFGAGSLEKGAAPGEKVDFAVRSMAGTFKDLNKNYAQDQNTESLGTFNLAAAVTRPVKGAAKAEKKVTDDKKADDKKDRKKDKKKDERSDAEPLESRAFVLADSDAVSDFVLSEIVGNQILFVDAVRWLVGEESVQGLPNTEEDVRIEHTKQGDLGWFYATIFGVPGLILGAGLFIGRRSRARGERK